MSLWRTEIHKLAESAGQITGICSLAEGADQVFAEVLLERGGRLEVVVPCRGYLDAFDSERGRQLYRELAGRASALVQLPFSKPCPEAYLAAGLVVVERCERLLALWDGQKARGLGGTADVVDYARAVGRPTTAVWPPGTNR